MHRIDATISGVSLVEHGPEAISRFSYSRFNSDHHEIHQLCRLFLEGNSVTEQHGEHRMKAFLIDMNVLFEKFVTQILNERAPLRTWVESQPRGLFLDQNGSMNIVPDLLLRRSNRSPVVVDCKYKKIGPSQFHGGDVYQVLSCCVALRSNFGALVYPRHEAAVDDSVVVRNTAMEISQLTVDLQAGFESIRNECDHLAQALFSRLG